MSPSWQKRLLLAVLAPALFLGLLELALAIADVNVARYDGLGDNGRYWIPWSPNEAAPDATPNSAEAAGGGAPASAAPGYDRVFPRRYKHFPEKLPLFLAEKPANGWRVFVLGESSVKGLPYEVGCFSDWMRLRATAMLPDRAVEVVNAGNVGWHATDIRALAQECLEHQPDALVWMVGNNEFTPHNVLTLRDEILHPVARALHDAVYSLRTTRWLGEFLPALAPVRQDIFDRKHNEEQACFGPELPLLKERFAETTAGVVADARAAGVPILICTMPRNLRQWAPSTSTFSEALRADPALRARWDEAYAAGLAALDAAAKDESAAARALEELNRAAALDETPAKLHYALGQAHEALGHADAARAAYGRALEQDGSPSRAQDWVEQAIRDVAASTGTPLVDLQKRFDAFGKLGIAGGEHICDAMHPSLSGHEIIANMVLDTMQRDLGVPFDRSRDIARADGRRMLGITDQQMYAVKSHEALNLAKLALQAGIVNDTWKQAHDACRAALEHNPADHEVKGGLGLLEAVAGNGVRARTLIEEAMARNSYVKVSYVYFWKTEPPYQLAFAKAGLDMAAVEAGLTPSQRLQLENHIFT